MIDPIIRLNPAKDSTVALMQACQRAGRPVWAATLKDLSAQASGASSTGHHAWVRAWPVLLAPMEPGPTGWKVPSPWYTLGEPWDGPLEASTAIC